MPGTPGLMHRIGGLEKQDITGNVSYDPHNHEHMVHTRARKVANVARDIPPQKVDGPARGDLLVLSLGRHLRRLCHRGPRGDSAAASAVAHAHLRYLNPFPANLGEILSALREGADPRAEPGPAAMP